MQGIQLVPALEYFWQNERMVLRKTLSSRYSLSWKTTRIYGATYQLIFLTSINVKHFGETPKQLQLTIIDKKRQSASRLEDPSLLFNAK